MEINYNDPQGIEKLSNEIIKTLDFPFLTLCIGTDKCIGDYVGPLVGHKLTKKNFPYPVYGTLEHPIHAINLVERLEYLEAKYPDLPFLAIDASLGKYKSIGKIQLRKGPISPGKGVGKVLPVVGDFSLVAIVDTYNYIEELSIHQVRLHLIYKMANIIAESLLLAIQSTKDGVALSKL